jgi:transcriptional regulator with XRE-family HTH domain
MSRDSYKPVKQVQKDHEILLKGIGDRIEEIRIQKGMSVTTLCNKVSMSRTTYYRIRDGLIYFNTEKFFKICDELGAEITFDIRVKSDQ